MNLLFRVITTVAIIGLTSIGLGYLYLKIEHVNLDNNNRSIEKLSQISQLSIEEDLEILRINFGQSTDYE